MNLNRLLYFCYFPCNKQVINDYQYKYILNSRKAFLFTCSFYISNLFILFLGANLKIPRRCISNFKRKICNILYHFARTNFCYGFFSFIIESTNLSNYFVTQDQSLLDILPIPKTPTIPGRCKMYYLFKQKFVDNLGIV